MQDTMKAVLLDDFGDAEQMHMGTCAIPQPGAHELLVKVYATALNRADILQRKGKYPPPAGASELLGLELAGEVVACGDGVTRYAVGDAVFGLLPGGGYAQYAVIHEGMAMPKPERMTWEEAAAVPETFLTAYQALVWNGGLKCGETALIHAGASGVGTAAIQIARNMDAEVIVTASAGKHERLKALGAASAIDYKAGSFVDVVKAFTNKRGVDVIVDFIAGPNFVPNVDVLAMDGRLVMLAAMGGGRIGDLDVRKILGKRLTIKGSTLRNRMLEYQIDLTAAFSAFGLERLADGRMKPVIDCVMEWHDVVKAHHYMEDNKNTGKIVLRISQD